jgi:Tfp pilus assembly protein PilX
MMGVVLPVVLVILTVLTALVVMQVRRATVDERLAGYTREAITLDTATQTVLRWCEWRITTAPFETKTVVTVAGKAAWLDSNNWKDDESLNFTGVNLPGVTGSPACVIEDATCELSPPISTDGKKGSACNTGLDDRWRKFRITARVQTLAPDLPGGTRTLFAQSELRLYTD